MERWHLYAVLSMALAGVVAVVAKVGLGGISAELGLAVRTAFVALFVLAFAAAWVDPAELRTLTAANLGWLAVSAAATAGSWVFYYKAIHDGEVATVAVIDKGSFLVAVALAALVLGERVTLRTAAGCGLILAGMLVAARK